MTDIHGIDVSRWNGLANLGSQQFQIARATFGTTPDPRYGAHTANAHAYGVVTGAYHFGVGGSVSAQVDAFVKVAGTVSLYALDLERNGSGASMTNAQAASFLSMFKSRTHRGIGLYHSAWAFPKLGQDWDWIAEWDTDVFPSGSELWQYQGNPIDRNKFHGDAAAWAAFVGGKLGTPHWRVTITGYTPLYASPGGAKVDAVSLATYLCTRSKVDGLWWYRIVSKANGSATVHAGQYFKPNRNVTAHLI